MFASIAAVGAGLHVAALVIEHEAHIGQATAVLSIAAPVGVFVVMVFGLQAYLAGSVHGGDVVIVFAALAILALGVVLAVVGFGLITCLVVITAAPVLVAIIDEVRGRPRQALVGEDG